MAGEREIMPNRRRCNRLSHIFWIIFPLAAIQLATTTSNLARGQQIAATINHHEHSNFGLYSAQAQQPRQPVNQLPQASQQQQQQQPQASNRTPRVGLAPQERPACQLKPLAALKRRHLSGVAGEQQQQEFAPLASANLTTDQQHISVPNASLLNQKTSNNKTISGQLDLQANLSVNQQRVIATRVDTSERLRQLRQLLVSNNYDAYLVTPNDEHGSEYVSDYDRRLRFISGFTGSKGYALVLLDRAVLFTDGRYALQAELDLDCNWWLVVGDEPLADLHQWLRAQNARGLKVATDARLMSLQSFDYLEEQLKRLDQSEFALISQDLIDVVWDNHVNSERLNAMTTNSQANTQNMALARERPTGSLQVHPIEFAGLVSWQEKVLRLAQAMEKLRARHYVVSKLDDIAWLLNLRGSDIPMSPLFKAYLLVSRAHSTSSNVSPTTSSGGSEQAATSVAPSDTTASKPLAPINPIDQLLLSTATNSQQQASDQLSLQAPQVLQVPVGQVIKVTLYVDLRKVQAAHIREHLHLDNWTSIQMGPNEPLNRIQVELRDYDVFIMDFRDKFGAPIATQQQSMANANGQPMQASNKIGGGGGKLLLDAMANVAIHVLAKNYDERLILVEPLITRLKAVKSDLEVVGMRQAHWRDSLAIAMLLGQLEVDINQLKRTERWTETSAARELEFYRSLMDFNRGQSFDTISAYGSNGAIVHYKPPSVAELEQLGGGQQAASAARFIGNKSTYLLDSGGQYLDGTTDITRTVHFGQPSEFQRETYTRVLMGAIDMMSLIFDQSPTRSNSPAYRLNDLLARRHLMEIGLDYMHGTGHGIGAFSLVHEAPALIEHYATSGAAASSNQRVGGSRLTSSNQAPIVLNEQLTLQANMFTSVEPGYYKAGDFGIRLENIVVTQRVAVPQMDSSDSLSRANVTWLRFEPISLVPFEPKLIKFELLSNKQKAWLNSYNLMVRLRMTQQINYYLTKVRQSQASGGAASQLVGLNSSSRLYQQLREQLQRNNSTTSSSEQQQLEANAEALGKNNYLKLEASKFQQLLEQAHRWIMAKTELIPLDVPQQMISITASQECNTQQADTLKGQEAPNLVARMKQPGQQQAATNARGDEWSALGAEPNGQRLMLAYMSSLPFNDAEAARAVATLAARSLPTAAAPNDSSLAWSQKCSGIECDLLLLEALNSHQQSLIANNNKQQQQQRRSNQNSASQSQLQGDDGGGDESPKTGGALLDLFQLNSQSDSAPGWLSLAGVWPILGLALLLTLQLAVMAYVCVGGGNGGRKSRSPTGSPRRSPNSSRRASLQQQPSGQSMPLAQAAAASSSLVQQQQRRRDSAGHLSQCSSLVAGAPMTVVAEVTSGGGGGEESV